MITLRKAAFSDAEFLWNLRNQPNTYKYFHSNGPISWEEHIDWINNLFSGVVKNKDLFIIQNSGRQLGQIRIDYNYPGRGEISVSISEESQKNGFAAQALGLIVREAKQKRIINALIAQIHEDNIASIKLFKKFNFEFKQQKGKWIDYVLNF